MCLPCGTGVGVSGRRRPVLRPAAAWRAALGPLTGEGDGWTSRSTQTGPDYSDTCDTHTHTRTQRLNAAAQAPPRKLATASDARKRAGTQCGTDADTPTRKCTHAQKSIQRT